MSDGKQRSFDGSDILSLLGGMASGFLFQRQAGSSFSSHVGQVLSNNKEAIAKVASGPIFSRLSQKDEQMFAGVEIYITGNHCGMHRKDILTKLLGRMGTWASDRFRSIVIGIPNPERKDGHKVGDKTVSVPIEYTEHDLRVKFLNATIDDVIRFGTLLDGAFNVEQGIERVLINLKVRNVADADSVISEVARFWHGPKEESLGAVALALEQFRGERRVARGKPCVTTEAPKKPLNWFHKLFS